MLAGAAGRGERVSIGREGGDVVISTRRLDQVLEHEAGDLTAIVEAGVRVRDLNDRLAEHGQMLALDPPGNPTIGACIAANLSGPRRHRYGTARDLVIGVTVVLADGTIASSGRQGRQERRRLRPRQAVLRLGGAARADRARGAAAAPAAGGVADAGRAGSPPRTTARPRPGRSCARRSRRRRSTCSGRACSPCSSRAARAGWRNSSRSSQALVGGDEDYGSVWEEVEARQASARGPAAVRARRARRRRSAGSTRRSCGWPPASRTCRSRSPIRATRRRSRWPSASAPQFDPTQGARVTVDISRELIDDCVHCGFCLPTCPTYGPLWQEEMDSPRGRILLMCGLVDGTVELSATTVQHFDRCLGCMACVTSCPSGVRYDRLIEQTRAHVEEHHQRSDDERAPAGAGLRDRAVPAAAAARAGADAAAAARAAGAVRGAEAAVALVPSRTAGGDAGGGGAAAAGRAPARLRPARRLRRRERGDRPGAGGRGLRGGRAARARAAAARCTCTPGRVEEGRRAREADRRGASATSTRSSSTLPAAART